MTTESTAAAMPAAPSTIGERIRARRLTLGLSRAALSEASGLAVSTICLLEGGKRGTELPAATLRRLATALQSDPWWLLDGEPSATEETGPHPAVGVGATGDVWSAK